VLRAFPSLDAARRRFDELARLEPRLAPLWGACEQIAHVEDEIEDPFDVDSFEVDELLASEDGWCAEDQFFRTIKPQIGALVGFHREEDPAELQTPEAYDAVYSALFHHALIRQCACCAERVAA
jgi:hypothetical protein